MRLDPIVIHFYESWWPEIFERERMRVEAALGRWLTRDVEHMGSTAVPGLPAKEIIDMLAVVDDIHGEPRVNELMAGIEWLPAPEPTDEADRKLSFCYPSIERRTHHLHVVEESSGSWRGWLAFRDYLRTHDDTRDEYAALKVRLAELYGRDPNDRDAYRAGKAGFVQRITDTARGAAT